ncbi:MAG: putative protease htpX [Nitrososphaeraceae archaeon]|jgi:heat shock protein HtpX|nr:putative protease htpX [Nitrososphaeraceae archaeon]MCD6036274.1 putative protease htpX [Nitrososphaeraceae archaeon]MDF2767888.1 putative protease htpX [Nitrososphaeraceae archaeon]
MILSFAILALLYIIFLSVLVYLGVGFIPIMIIASLMILAQWYFSDKIVLWSSGAKVVTRDQFPKLHDMVERIVARNNLPKPKIAVINTNMPNAFATGKGQKSSIVAVTTGLMDILDDPEELEGVIAHELTHIRNRDVLVLTLASVFATVAWYLMQFGFYGGLHGGMGYGRDRNSGGTMIIVIVVAVLVWVISFLIIRAISRYREFSADRGAAQMTGKPVKLANALMKISGTMRRVPTKDLRQVEGLNAFFIIPAISGSTIGNLFSTHPPTEKRVQKLMEMEASMS